MRLWKTAFVILCLFAAQAFPAYAGIYKWTDQQGIVHYADQAPASGRAQALSSGALPNINVVTATAPTPSLHSSKTRKPKVRKHASKRRRSASRRSESREKRKKRCAHYAHEIEVIQARLRAGYREPQGNRWHAKERALASERFRECQGI